MFLSFDTPSFFGPRHCGQLSANVSLIVPQATTALRNMLEIRTAFIDRCIGDLLMFIRLMFIAQDVLRLRGYREGKRRGEGVGEVIRFGDGV
jgi:hypothetical protein